MNFPWKKNKQVAQSHKQVERKHRMQDVSSMSAIERQVLEHSVLLIQKQFRFYKAVEKWRWVTSCVLAQSFAGLKAHHQSELRAMKLASQTINRLHESKATLEIEHEQYIKHLDQTELKLVRDARKFYVNQIVAYNDEISTKIELLQQQYRKKLLDQTLIARLEQGETFDDIFSQYQQILQNDLRAQTASYQKRRRRRHVSAPKIASASTRRHSVDDYQTVYEISKSFYPASQFNIGPTASDGRPLPLLNAQYSRAANDVMELNCQTFDRWANVDKSLLKKDFYVLRQYHNQASTLQEQLDKSIAHVELQHKNSLAGISQRFLSKKQLTAQNYQSKFMQLADERTKWKRIVLNLRAAMIYFGRDILQCKLEGKNYFPAMSMNKEIEGRKKILANLQHQLVEDNKEYWISRMKYVRERWQQSRSRRQRQNVSEQSSRFSSSIEYDSVDILTRFAKTKNMVHNEIIAQNKARKMLNELKHHHHDGLQDMDSIRKYILYKKIENGKLQHSEAQWKEMQSLTFRKEGVRSRQRLSTTSHTSQTETTHTSDDDTYESFSSDNNSSFRSKFAANFDGQKPTENNSGLFNSSHDISSEYVVQLQKGSDSALIITKKNSEKFSSWSIATQHGSINDKLVRKKQINKDRINSRTLTYRNNLRQIRPSTTPLPHRTGITGNLRIATLSKLKSKFSRKDDHDQKFTRRNKVKINQLAEKQQQRSRMPSRVPVWSTKTIFRKAGLRRSRNLEWDNHQLH